LAVLYRRQSSANNLAVPLTLLRRSFIYTRNKSGPRTVPSGTPDVHVTGSVEDDSPSTTTLWVRFLRKPWIQRSVDARMP
jgi:hypothetical protein